VESTDFLFDIFNYLVGLHNLNKIKICDVVLSLSNFDIFFDSYSNNQQTLDFFDHILLRTITFENMRTHFPIIIDSNKSRMVGRDILYMMNID
jgi:hypothetical protein